MNKYSIFNRIRRISRIAYPLPRVFPAQRQLVAHIEHGQATLRVVRKLGRARMEQLLLVGLGDVRIAKRGARQSVRGAFNGVAYQCWRLSVNKKK